MTRNFIQISALLCLFSFQVFCQAPNWLTIEHIGGMYYDRGHSIATDAFGNAYFTGSFAGTVDFDPGPGIFNLTSAGNNPDIFISKLDASGSLVWAKTIGSANGDVGIGITLDAFGNVYATGVYRGTVDFDPGTGVFNLTSVGLEDIFVSKLDTSGNFVWAKSMGGVSYEQGRSLAIDGNGSVYLTGMFGTNVDFDPGPGVYNLTDAGNYDIYILKLDSSGSFLWAKRMGSNNTDWGRSLTLDHLGNIYLAGFFRDTVDFDPDSASTFNLIAPLFADEIFVVKLTGAGNFVWAKRMGGKGLDAAESIVVDNSGNIYTTGHFKDTADFDPGPATFNFITAYQDIFVSKLDSSGDFVWAKAFAGTGPGNNGVSMTLDAAGNIYITGTFDGPVDFDPGPGAFNLSPLGDGDIYIVKLNSSGNFVWAKSAGGVDNDFIFSLALSVSGRMYLLGQFESLSIFFDSDTLTNNSSFGYGDIFIAAMDNITGVMSIMDQENFSVFPNPCAGTFSIYSKAEVKSGRIEINNVLGEKIYSDSFNGFTKQIRFTGQPGIYFVRVIDGEKVSVSKMVKE